MEQANMQGLHLRILLARKFTFPRWGKGVLCLLVGALLSCEEASSLATNPLDEFGSDVLSPPPPYEYTVVFDKNGGDTEAEPSTKTVVQPATTLDALPAEPVRAGYHFDGWNTRADGEGTPLTETTPIDADLTVYALWAPPPHLSFESTSELDTWWLTPMVDGNYSERGNTFSFTISGFRSDEHASKADIEIYSVTQGLVYRTAKVVSTTVQDKRKTFELFIEYTGTHTINNGKTPMTFLLHMPQDYVHDKYKTIQVNIRDGRASTDDRIIQVNKENFQHFSKYVHTNEGLSKHYYLVDPIELTGNWTPIGTRTTGFTGGFDGRGNTISNIRIDNSSEDLQGFFGHIAASATLKNLGLKAVNISGKHLTGGMAGAHFGKMENCYVEGTTVKGNSGVGGLLGGNDGTVHNCYAMINVEGETDRVGGLVGENSRGRVENCYATGDVKSKGNFSNFVGGVVGLNTDRSTVKNCLALNSIVSSNNEVGRVAGSNNTNVLSNNHAFAGIKNKNNNTNWGNIGLNEMDGKTTSAAELRNFPAALRNIFQAEPWTYQQGRLPGLFGQTVVMPAHIQ